MYVKKHVIYGVIRHHKIKEKILEIQFLTDLGDCYLTLMDLVRGFQIIFTFYPPIAMTSLIM